jgi:hypothetical protein
MTEDFGVRSRRGKIPVGRIIAAVWIVAIVGAAGGKFYLDRQAGIKNAREWAAVGPPCPADTTPVDDGFQPGQRAFAFAGVKFLGDFKTVKCSTARDQGGTGQGEVDVCKLKGASRIDLTTAKGRFRFATSRQNATLSIEQGVASCVLDAG